MSMPMSLRLPLILALLLTLGCNGDDPAGPPDISGTYALISVDGEELPVEVDTGEGLYEILSGQFIVNAAGTCAGSITVQEVGTTTPEVMSNNCTWTRNQSAIAIAWSDGPVDIGTVQGNQLAFIAQDLMGLALVFQR